MIARFASVRLVKRRPAFVALIAATTILGLGAGIAMARLYDRVLLRALPFTGASELVSVGGVMINYARPVTILPEYHPPEFVALGLYDPGAVNVGVGDASVRVPAARVDGGFFDVLRVPLSAGRPLSNEDQGLRHAVVVAEWWESLGRRRDLTSDDTLWLDDEPFRVVGLVPRTFAFPPGTSVWVPPYAGRQGTSGFLPRVIGRLAPHVSRRDAAFALGSVRNTPPARRDALVRPLATELGESIRPAFEIILVLIGLVFVCTFVNVASLWIFRIESLRGEYTIRSALGASRPRLLLHHAAEALPLTVASVGLAFLLAVGMVTASAGMMPELTSFEGFTAVDGDFIGIGVVVLVLALGAFVIAPGLAAWQASGRSRPGTRLSKGVHATLVTAQIGLAMVLTAATATLLATVVSLTRVDVGLRNPETVVTQLGLPSTRYRDPTAVGALLQEVEDEVRRAVGTRVGITSLGPGDGSFTTGVRLSRDGGQEPVSMPAIAVTPEYFDAIGLPIQAGRGFERGDDGRRVIVLTEAAARRIEADPPAIVGETVVMSGETAEVVGVVTSPRIMGPASHPSTVVFHPFAFQPADALVPSVVTMAVASLGTHGEIGTRLQQVVAGIDPAITVYGTTRVADIMRRQMRNEWLALVLASASAGAALLLCAIGIYGLLAQFVVTRTRDIAVRLMLGARARDARIEVLRLSLRVAVVGIVVGVAGAAFALARLAQASLPTLIVPAPLVLVASALFVLAAAVVVSMGPANRAAAIDPVRVLQP